MATAPKTQPDALEKLERRRAIHLSRYNRHIFEGMSAEQIAREDRCTVGTVRESIERMKRYFEMAKLAELETQQISTIMSVGPLERKAIEALLTANWTDEKGVVHPDLEARAKGVKLINEKIEAIKPKGTGPTTQVAVMTGGNIPQSQPQVSVTSSSPATNDFEGIVRKVRTQQGLLPPPQDEAGVSGEEVIGEELTEEDLSDANSPEG